MAKLRILWRERYFEALCGGIQGNQAVRELLARYGVLKFLENPLMRASEPLLSKILSY